MTTLDKKMTTQDDKIEQKRHKNLNYVKNFYKARGGRGKYYYVLNIPQHNIYLKVKNKNDILKFITKCTKSSDFIYFIYITQNEF